MGPSWPPPGAPSGAPPSSPGPLLGLQEGPHRAPRRLQEGPQAGPPAVKLAALVLDSRGAPRGALLAPSRVPSGALPTCPGPLLGLRGGSRRASKRLQEGPQAGPPAVKLAALVLDSRGAPLGTLLAPSRGPSGALPGPLLGLQEGSRARRGPSESSRRAPRGARAPPSKLVPIKSSIQKHTRFLLHHKCYFASGPLFRTRS